MAKLWDLTITHGSCMEWLKVTIATGIMNTVTDTIILILPLFILRKIRLPIREKLAVALVLMAGGL